MKRNSNIYDHIKRMKSEKFVKKSRYMRKVEGINRRRKSPEGQKDRVKQYMCERSATVWEELNKQEERVWTGRSGSSLKTLAE